MLNHVAMLLQIGLGVFAVGVIAVVVGLMNKWKAARVADAPLVATGAFAARGRSVAGPKGQVSTQGTVLCQQPLISPVTGTPCLFYEIKCTAEWKEGDETKRKVIDERKGAASFVLDDGSGPMPIDASAGGDFEPSVKKTVTQGAGLLGGITGTELVFGQYRVNTPMLDVGTKYTVEEEILPLQPRLFALGSLGAHGEITAPNWRSLILSSKSRDELLASASSNARFALVAGIVALVVGAGMSGTAELLEDDDPPAATTASVATSTPAPSSTPVPAASSPPPVVIAAPTASSTTAPPTKKKGKAKVKPRSPSAKR